MKNNKKKTLTAKGISPRIIGIELLWYFAIAVITCLILYTVLELWNVDIRYPFEYQRDVLGVSSDIKNYIESGQYIINEYMSAPYYYNGNDYFAIAIIPYVLVKFLALFSSNYASILNVYYILGFVMVAMSAFCVLRMLKYKRGISMVCAILFSFLPYHFWRGEEHLFLGAYYTVPFVCLICLWILNGEIINSNELSLKKLLRNPKMWVSVLTCICVAMSDIYYFVFSAICMVIAGIFSLFTNGEKRHFFCSLFLVLIMGGTILICLLPTIINLANKPMDVIYSSRAVTDVEVYGLKLIQLLLPRQNHRIELLSNIRKLYDSQGIYVNENTAVSLGLIIATGFIISVFIGLLNKKHSKEIQIVESAGKMNIALFVIATMGGLSSFIGLFLTSAIRCYNRMCIYIAMFSIIVVAYYVQNFVLKRINIRGGQVIILGLILFVGVYDQTSEKDVFPYAQNRMEFEIDHDMVKKIEEVMDDGDMIFQLPLLEPNGIQQRLNMGEYDLYKPYLHSTKLKWLHRYSTNSDTGKWIENLLEMDMDTLLDVVAMRGFDGIYINKEGYTEEEMSEIQSVLELLCDGNPIESVDGRMIFYDIRSFKEEKIRNVHETYPSMTDDNLNYLVEHIRILPVNSSSLYYLGEYSINKNNEMVISTNGMQYGPYLNLSSGKYRVTVYGSGIENEMVDVMAGGELLEIDFSQKTNANNKVQYELDLDEYTEKVEFRLNNNCDKDITFKKLIIEKLPEDYSVDSIIEVLE